jgi:glutamine---fructose-6-phosphate transaminase (isomerizing)
MEEMIAAQAELPDAIAEASAAVDAIGDRTAEAAAERAPIVATGCGTAGHGAQGVAEVLNEALGDVGHHPGGAVQWRPAFEAALAPWRGGMCVGISHGGRSRATVAALAAARAAGATTALVTARSGTPAEEVGDEILNTRIVDRSWCHTIGYLAPIVAAAAVADRIRGAGFNPAPLARLFEQALAPSESYDEIAAALVGAERVVVAGSGPDLIAARELALKISEGAWLPATAYELEDVLHGHLVAHDGRSALLALVTGARAEMSVLRTASLLRTARRIGLRTALVASRDVDAEIDEELTSAGRIMVAGDVDLAPSLTSLIASGVALQRLTLALAHRLGQNPDLLRREVVAYREARGLAESKFFVET